MAVCKHLKEMRLYVQDAEETDTPWERWEYFIDTQGWAKLGAHPCWDLKTRYRRKTDAPPLPEHKAVASASPEIPDNTPERLSNADLHNAILTTATLMALGNGSVNLVMSGHLQKLVDEQCRRAQARKHAE